jgi:pimeloyl-ACP methyl ester carboxylesterase
VLHTDLSACNSYAAGFESAAQVACPAMFILGARDMMTPPRGAEALVAKMKDARVERIRPSGHSLMAEAPDATLDALIGFLA